MTALLKLQAKPLAAIERMTEPPQAPRTPQGVRLLKLPLAHKGVWDAATELARETARAREALVQRVREVMTAGLSQNKAVEHVLMCLQHAHISSAEYTLYQRLVGKSRKTITRSTLCAWVKAYQAQGREGLLPQHKGRVVGDEAWHNLAVELYNTPANPDMSTIHLSLQAQGYEGLSYARVSRFLSRLPAQWGKHSPKRMGTHLHRLKEKPYVSRDWSDVRPGDIYMADGYKADVRIAHPVNGSAWRPELSVVVDVASQAIVGWRMSEAENAQQILLLWQDTFERHNHVPPMIYLDNGSGFKNKLALGEASSGEMSTRRLLACEATLGYYRRAGVQEVVYHIPGNPHGKTFIERTFRSIKEKFLKVQFPDFYCGHDAEPSQQARVVNGKVPLPSVAQLSEAFNAWIDRHNSGLVPDATVDVKGKTRAAYFAERLNIPPHLEGMKPQKIVTVQRARIRFDNREYTHPALYAWNRKKVIAEYALDSDAVVQVRTLEGRLICDAPLVQRKKQLTESRLADARQKALTQSEQRLERKLSERRAKAGQVIDMRKVADNTLPFTSAPIPRIEDEDELVLDLVNLATEGD